MSESEIDPDSLTSPGTVDDPDVEQKRAREAAEREAESRASDTTKLEAEREAERKKRAALAAKIAAEPLSGEESTDD
ncbi:MAG TPA: hypothetical protein VH538_08910 [Gaiellaceae bacterium]|jgi:hypothetical protein